MGGIAPFRPNTEDGTIYGAARTPAPRDGGGPRGVERRRAAIEYLRQNMHELRPVENGQRSPGAARTVRG